MWLTKPKTKHLPITNTSHVENGYSENHLQNKEYKPFIRAQSLNIQEKVNIYFLY